MSPKVLMIARGALIAALYATVTVIFAPISYRVIQVRISEALTLMPFLWIEAIPGLFVGCFIANILGGNGPLDIVLGSFATLIAAVLTRFAPNKLLAATSPVVVNGVVVGTYLAFLLEMPIVPSILYVAVGEAIACYALGLPLLRLMSHFPYFQQKK
jgi:uncharacterized membrane protein